MLNSLKNRLLLWFVAFVLLATGIVLPSGIAFRAREKANQELLQQVNALHVNFVKASRSFGNRFTGANAVDFSGSIQELAAIRHTLKQISRYPLKAHVHSDALQVLDQSIRRYERLFIETLSAGHLDDMAPIYQQEREAFAAADSQFEAFTQQINAGRRTTALAYVAVLLVLLLLAAGLGYLASKHLVMPLEKLNRYIGSLNRNTALESRADYRHAPVEIRPVYLEFHKLFNQLKTGEQQRDHALKNANDNHQRYRELTDLLPQSVFETDSYGNYTYVNKAWYKAFGYVQADLDDGLNLIETLISGSQHDDILGMQKIQNSSFIARRKNGSKFPASVYTDNIMRHGQVAGKRGIIIDITDKVNYIRSLQQETSRAKTSDELKSSFLANMSHEIRTPMNSIIGFSNLLASEQIPDSQKKDFTQYIRTSSEILLNLVDDIIDIAKIEAGELKIVKKDCDLNALGNELLTTSEETRKRLGKAQIKLHFMPDDGSRNVLLKTDPFRLRQVLINLINNALKFTENGTVDFGYRIKEDRLVEFFVKDTGPGLTREELDLIFERFKRAKFSEEKNIAGTGLGLAISRNLVKLLGGEMWVDSVAGEGTTFLFTLPYLRTTVLADEPDQRKSTDSHYNWQGKTLLIAEDDPNSFRFLRELLAGTQATILHAATGKQAVEAVSSNRVDLVLMDILLPEMDGLEATRNIKLINPQLPVIAQTAYAMSGDMEKMKAAGCDDYISKPLDLKKLLIIMQRYLLPGNNNLTDKTTVYRHNPSGIISN